MTRQLDPGSPGSVDTLRRIAEALAMPVDAFFDTEPAPGASAVQLVELVTAFVAIDDGMVRNLCLAFVKASAGVELVVDP